MYAIDNNTLKYSGFSSVRIVLMLNKLYFVTLSTYVFRKQLTINTDDFTTQT